MSIKCERLFDRIDGLYDEYLKVREDICNLESPTMNKELVDAVGKYCMAIAEKKGCKTEVEEYVKRPASIIYCI